MKSDRNYGIDLLRIISMLMIVTLHILGQGGILASTVHLCVNYEIAWLLDTLCYCAVNCYALISGYVGAESRFKYSNIIKLWLQVVFSSVVITLLFSVFMPDTVGINQYINAFFPVSFNQYWYFTAYFCMFFFIPFLNHILNTMQKKDLKILILTIVGLFSVLQTVIHTDIFGTYQGLSALWLAFLYLIGGYIKNTSRFQIGEQAKQ